ncbi:hypothetical protein JXB31_02920 [Candidatus Woesearchaeota archaeon]|nr:hypothetical protein [Candidatus Woesearchaeota archaeon]
MAEKEDIENETANNKNAVKKKGLSDEKTVVFVLLAIVFLVVFGLRLYFAFSTPNFTDTDSYFVLRQVESIRDSGQPLFHDNLSYGGRDFLFLPLFHYLLALFSSVMPVVAACKVMLNLTASTSVFAVFLIVRQISRNRWVALFSAFISGFIPVYVSETLNTVSVYAMTIPLMLFLLYFFLRINIRKNPNYFIILFFLLILLDISSYIVIFAILIYLVLSWLEGLNVGRAELELSLFSVFIMALLYIILFRQAFLQHGYMVIWNNTPQALLGNYFSDVDILSSIYSIGVIPAIAGVFVILLHLFRKKKSVYLPMSFSLLVGILLVLKLIPISYGLMVLSLLFVILSGEMFLVMDEYIKRTRFKRFRLVIYMMFMLLFAVSSVIPSFSYARQSVNDSVPNEEIAAFYFLGNITKENDTIVTTVYDGHLVTYLSGRKNIMDSNFLLAEDAEERLADLKKIYTSAIASKPIGLLDKYDAEYIVFNNKAREFYNISRLAYIDEECFPLIFTMKDVRVYEKKCSIG